MGDMSIKEKFKSKHRYVCVGAASWQLMNISVLSLFFVFQAHKCIAATNKIKAVEVKSDIRNFALQCLLYRTDQAQDVKKIEKFHSQLMRLMVAKESRSAAMETD